MKLENNPPVKLMFDEYNQYGENDNLDDNIINSNQGILILGPAGTGKTYLINSVINKLENKKILRLAPTNKAALLIKGQTLDRFAYNLIFSRKNSFKYKNIDYVFVDEISMVSSRFIKVLLSLKYYNPDIKFIISGDFYQIPPVKDNTTKLVSRSKALYELVDGNMCNLTICKRSNHELFDICEKVKHGKNIDTSIFNNKESYLNITVVLLIKNVLKLFNNVMKGILKKQELNLSISTNYLMMIIVSHISYTKEYHLFQD